MAISVFDLFKIGIGPSSSHTVGPMKAAGQFVARLREADAFDRAARLRVELYGSLGATGRGHGSDKAVILGLEGENPEDVDVESIPERVERVREGGRLRLGGEREIGFDHREDLTFDRRQKLPHHPNGMRFTALDEAGETLLEAAFYSVGGGFVVDEEDAEHGPIKKDDTELPYPFTTAVELLGHSKRTGFAISDIMLENETAWLTPAETRERLLKIWRVMDECIDRGCATEGTLPGLKVERRAAALHAQLSSQAERSLSDPLTVMDWVDLYALAVNEENAAGGRVVTAPTNGAAGIIPAVLRYFVRFRGADEDDIVRFLLTAGAIGVLFKENASISGAEVGCQGEVGSACSMAAGALAEGLGGTPEQAENAAEIGMEHNLGLTCDPIAGLVQIPCIERNAMAAIKAINAARLALRGSGQHFVSLDKVIKTMRDTGRDMKTKYKETARGGLAVNVIEVPVNVIEC
ncbi:L-serine ammonia-lyase [Lentisalinibacter salinarum]|uniref:L-serine ammonia-lyase n=1 Tax=Lentisalinibacter salinarum TaxID=2992239 RepID=UPI0038688482